MDARDPFKDGNVNVDKNNSALVYEIESFNTRKSIFTFSNIMLGFFYGLCECVCAIFPPAVTKPFTQSCIILPKKVDLEASKQTKISTDVFCVEDIV